MITLLQQQSSQRPVIASDAWKIWSPETIAAILSAPVENVRSQWPLVFSALEEFGIADETVLTAAIATIGVESGTFLPVREAWWLDEDYRRRNFRYFPHYGRGLIQLTWRSNYEAAEQALGIVGLADNPDLALQQDHSARIFAWFFASRPIPQAARRGDWVEVRRLVQGADAGLRDFLSHIRNLQAARQE